MENIKLPSDYMLYNLIGLLFGGITGLIICESFLGLIAGLLLGFFVGLFFYHMLVKDRKY